MMLHTMLALMVALVALGAAHLWYLYGIEKHREAQRLLDHAAEMTAVNTEALMHAQEAFALAEYGAHKEAQDMMGCACELLEQA